MKIMVFTHMGAATVSLWTALKDRGYNVSYSHVFDNRETWKDVTHVITNIRDPVTAGIHRFFRPFNGVFDWKKHGVHIKACILDNMLWPYLELKKVWDFDSVRLKFLRTCPSCFCHGSPEILALKFHRPDVWEVDVSRLVQAGELIKIPVLNEHSGVLKKHVKDLLYVKENIHKLLPELAAVKHSAFMRDFYTPEEADAIFERWAA